MAKLLAVATLAGFLLVLIANASAYKTIITTVQVDDGTSNPESQGCREQVQRVDLSQCEQYLSQSRGDLLVRRYHNEQDVQQCCSQIKQVERDCQCEALAALLLKAQMQQRPEHGQEQEVAQQLGERAVDIQRECGLPKECFR